VNVGDEYQAELPECRGKLESFFYYEKHKIFNFHFNFNKNKAFHKNDNELNSTRIEDLMMCPTTFGEDRMTAKRLDDYLDLVCRSSLIYGSSNNLELGLHVLHHYAGDFKEAIKALLSQSMGLPEAHPITTYKYSETDLWSQEEIKRFEAAILKHDKVFGEVAAEVESKTTKQCVEFYYLWKKVMSDGARKKWRLVKKHRYVNNGAEAAAGDEAGGNEDGVKQEPSSVAASTSTGKKKERKEKKSKTAENKTASSTPSSPKHLQGVKLECVQCNMVTILGV
jgi:hypothetical protein